MSLDDCSTTEELSFEEDEDDMRTDICMETIIREETRAWIAEIGPKLFSIEYKQQQKRIEQKQLADAKKKVVNKK